MCQGTLRHALKYNRIAYIAISDNLRIAVSFGNLPII